MGKHSEWRKVAKKVRRSRIRQKLAKERCGLEEKADLKRQHSPSYQSWLQEQKILEDFQLEEERRLSEEGHRKWLKAEQEAQKQWKLLQAKLTLARAERARQDERIRQEWENEQKKHKEAKEKQKLLQEEKEKQAELLKKQVEHFMENGGNVPEELNVSLETNPNKPICPFFQKTGACRFRDSCSRNHVRPSISRILLFPHFYAHFSLAHGADNECANDLNLEFEYTETYNHFETFFYDVLPELEKSGHIRQFKVCCNQEIHLRGNVYVEFSKMQEAMKAYQTMQGRWYGGKQLNVEFCNILSWKAAICGLFFKQRCPKGSSCNFLHVFRNPMNMFNLADRDLHRTPIQNEDEECSKESDSKHWRWSESPERITTNEILKKSEKEHKSRGREKHHRRKRSRSRSKHRTKSKYSSLHHKSRRRSSHS